MNNSTPTSHPETSPSLASLRATHNQLLKQYRQTDFTPELLAEIRKFLLRGRVMGALLDIEDDRCAAQSLLDYWISILYRQGEEPPDATLVEFNPSLSPKLKDSLCPYLGLNAFQGKDHKLFYGRQQLLDKLLAHLQENNFLAVIGSSGSGKSSVVLGGLIPSLKAGRLPESQTWHYYSSMVPGSHPLENLAYVLCRDEQERDIWVEQQIEGFQSDTSHLLKLLDADSTQPKVLVIDQFEEAFTLCLESQNCQRQAFINNLLTVIESPQSHHIVILTMRSDFQTWLAKYPNLQQQFERGQVQVMAMDARELREAIEKPAKSIGLKFEEGLVDELLEDVLGEPAALPLLQFTLLKLWENRERNRVTKETYERLGGGRLALSRSADEFYNKLIRENKTVVKQILLKMVKPTEGMEVTSSRIPRQSLYSKGNDHNRIDLVLAKLIETHLVRLTQGERADDVQVELAHEALVRNWPRLVRWLDYERVNLRTRWRLKSAAEQWRERDRDPSVLWWGRLLQDARLYEDLRPIEQEFVKCSLKAEYKKQSKEDEDKQKLQEAKEKLALARQRFWTGTTIFLMITVVVLAIFTISTKNQIIKEKRLRQTAENNLQKLKLLEDAEKVNESITNEPEEGLILAIKITGQSLKFGEVPEQIQESLQNAVVQVIPSLQGSSASVSEIAYNPNTQLIVTASDDGAIKLWNTYGTLVSTLEGHQERVTSVAFSPDGELIATASDDGAIKLWNTYGTLVSTLEGHQERVTSVAFSPDGTLLATASTDKTVKLWTTDGILVKTLKGHQERVTSVAFSPDGTLLATASADKTVKLWKIDGTFDRTLKGHQDSVTDVTFSPNSKLIATASADKTIKLWKPDGTLVKTLEEYQNWVTDVIFSPNGKLIVTASTDGTIKRWNIDGTLDSTISNPQGLFKSVSFSPDSQRIITISRDGVNRILDLQGKLVEELPNSQNEQLLQLLNSQDAEKLLKWEKLLELACNEMRDRPILKEPKDDIAKKAQDTCQTYVWDNN